MDTLMKSKPRGNGRNCMSTKVKILLMKPWSQRDKQKLIYVLRF